MRLRTTEVGRRHTQFNDERPKKTPKLDPKRLGNEAGMLKTEMLLFKDRIRAKYSCKQYCNIAVREEHNQHNGVNTRIDHLMRPPLLTFKPKTDQGSKESRRGSGVLKVGTQVRK